MISLHKGNVGPRRNYQFGAFRAQQAIEKLFKSIIEEYKSGKYQNA